MSGHIVASKSNYSRQTHRYVTYIGIRAKNLHITVTPIVAKVTPTFSQDRKVLSFEKMTFGSIVESFFSFFDSVSLSLFELEILLLPEKIDQKLFVFLVLSLV